MRTCEKCGMYDGRRMLKCDYCTVTCHPSIGTEECPGCPDCDAADAAGKPAPSPVQTVPCPHCGLLPDGSGPSLADLRAVRSQLHNLACMPDVQKAVVRVCRWIDGLEVRDEEA